MVNGIAVACPRSRSMPKNVNRRSSAALRLLPRQQDKQGQGNDDYHRINLDFP
jgi:hypothetical protein